MKVRVQFTAQLRTTLGRAAEDVELPEGSSVAELLQRLVSAFEAAAPHLLKPTGEPHGSLLVVVNDTAVAPQAVVQLRSGDVVTLLPPIAGG